ncbi:MAG: hypothetical protein ACKPCM_18775 [Pseudanabaena sp.]
MTEVQKLVKALSTGAKTKEEIEPHLGFRSVVKHVVGCARKQGFKITYQSKRYSLEQEDIQA